MLVVMRVCVGPGEGEIGFIAMTLMRSLVLGDTDWRISAREGVLAQLFGYL